MKIINILLDLIYPNICGICGEIDSNNLCKSCEEKINKIVISKIDNYKNDYSKFFTRHGYIFKYKGEMRNLMLKYKFNNKAYLHKTFSRIILNNKKIISFINNYEIVIPVPIHRKRFNNRGYNQTELIIKDICKNLKNDCLKNNILFKVKNNSAQSILNKNERVTNVKRAYEIKNENLIKGKTVLLVDDIYTTGNTVNECSKILKENGAKEIGILTVFKD